jgi:hypothetical protein
VVELVLWMTGDDAVDDVGEVCVRVNAVEFGGLCRTPNYAERTRFLPRFS